MIELPRALVIKLFHQAQVHFPRSCGGLISKLDSQWAYWPAPLRDDQTGDLFGFDAHALDELTTRVQDRNEDKVALVYMHAGVSLAPPTEILERYPSFEFFVEVALGIKGVLEIQVYQNAEGTVVQTPLNYSEDAF